MPLERIRRGAARSDAVLDAVADGPGKRELDPAVLERADRVVVDDEEKSRRIGELQGWARGQGPAPIPLGAGALRGHSSAEPGRRPALD